MLKWQNLPKPIQGLIIITYFIIIALFAVIFLLNKTTDISWIKGEVGKIAFAISGGIAAFIILLQIFLRSFKYLMAVLPLVPIMLVLSFSNSGDYSQMQPLAEQSVDFSNDEIPVHEVGAGVVILDSISTSANNNELAYLEFKKRFVALEESKNKIISEYKTQLSQAKKTIESNEQQLSAYKELARTIKVKKDSAVSEKILYNNLESQPKIVLVSISTNSVKLEQLDYNDISLLEKGTVFATIELNKKNEIIKINIDKDKSSPKESLYKTAEEILRKASFINTSEGNISFTATLLFQ